MQAADTPMARKLGAILNELLAQYGLTQRLKEFEAVTLWSEVVGPNVARVTQAREVRDGRLFVEVASSAWRNELYYLKPEIITELNKRMGQNIIHDILFV